MSVTPSSAIVGVFREQATAEQAMDAFYNAGFTHEQVRRSVPENSNGFFEDLKSLFTGSNNVSGDVANDLTGMGLSAEEANYYAQEHSNGNTILTVHAPGREQEAQAIMQQYGGYSRSSLQNTATPGSDVRQETTTNDTLVQPYYADTSSMLDAQTQQPGEQQPLHEQAPQPVDPAFVANTDETEQATQPYTEYTGTDPYHPRTTITPETIPSDSTVQATGSNEDTEPLTTSHVTGDDTAQPITMQDQHHEPEGTSPVTTDSNTIATHDAQLLTASNTTDVQTAQETTPTYTTEQQAPPSSIIQETAPVTDSTEPQATQLNDPAVTGQSPTTEPQSTQSASNPTNDMDEMQQLQTQFAAMQQQLQAVQAQLQAAKEQEAHLRTAKERQQQMETLRQQMQALQAELAAAHAELQDTHARISQYQ